MVNNQLLIFFLAFSFLWLWPNGNTLGGNLKPGDLLNQTDVLCSASGNYCMTFAEFSGSGFTYLVIIAQTGDRAVWIANRNEPAVNFSVALTLNYSATLKITRQDEEPIILYSSTEAANITCIASLFDTGNFVLQQLYLNGSVKSILWQSFDNPSLGLVQGMKLGVNHKTGQSWLLQSCISKNSPASGAFTLEWEPTSGQLIIRRREQIYWGSGKLINNKFEYISGQVQDMYNYTIVSNENEDSFSYTTKNNEYYWQLSDSGELFDSEGNSIASADQCYGYKSDGGCQTWNIPNCRHDGQFFYAFIGYLEGKYNESYDRNTSSTMSDCKAACWSNCDCLGFSSYFDNYTGCIFYNGDSWDVKNHDDGNSFLMIKTKSSEHKGVNRWIWVGSVITSLAVILCVGILCIVIQRRRKEKKKTMDTDTGRNLRLFSYASITEATNDFSSENKLGEGGFGPVYKGKLQMKTEVAIKRLSRSSRQGMIEFKNELRLISELQHTNLVQLLGYCIHGKENILIYEYMPNKSLDFFLFDSFQSRLLDWEKRFNIIEGVAQGLLYLHRYSRLKIIHRDLKASNILLDENMNPKISDFGLARIFTQELEENSTSIAGTLGYISPECIMQQVYSVKSDVYSFGVLILEIVSSRRNNCFGALVRHAWELWRDGEGLKLLDPAINDSSVHDQILKCINVALLCLEELAVNRPTMSEILSMLTNEFAPLPLPQMPAFDFGRRNYIEENETHAEHYIDTRNGLTISSMSAR
ncbi:hypothetical protein L6164_022846 [Bauhinia variegata]|uniref:Uncharacterized protein n=1 Tax=Bauhinia variegata TaxID=167791 RepID=A0ACB9MHS0_BAUVA|nr:hypothetical protein L6164_022846 [Bauhinia variegata]